jgi:glycosyltransferase involved in cell wall biosynthesis
MKKIKITYNEEKLVNKEKVTIIDKVDKNTRKISLCTTCMNRLHNLKETFIKNIEDNYDYKNTEFVLLDYNSNDGLPEWVQNNLIPYIVTGKVVYYRTTEPKYYSMSHSRNVAFKLATGNIVVNVDADNFTTKGFSAKINELSLPHESKVTFTKGNRLLRGRLGLFKRDFIDILGGYDESMVGYGYDDKDLYLRAKKLSFKPLWFNSSYIQRIHTSRKEKVTNMEIKNWRKTEVINKEISDKNIKEGKYKANQNIHWGKTTVIKNFKEEITI